MNIVVLIQARSSSSRLPRKVLMDVCGKPMIVRVFQQCISSTLASSVAVVTSNDISDVDLIQCCQDEGIPVFAGDLDDVLSRYYNASSFYSADVIVRITGDCPLISSDTIDEVVNFYLKNNFDYVSNTNPYTRPEGQDVEVFSFWALSQAHIYANRSYQREHVTPWIKSSTSMRIGSFIHTYGVRPELSLSVDYLSDYENARLIWSHLLRKFNPPFSSTQLFL